MSNRRQRERPWTQKAYFFEFAYDHGKQIFSFPFTEASASELSAILKKFVSKEATLEAAILKLHLAVKPCLRDVIPSEIKLAGEKNL